jgi:hypothetical protein
VTAKTPEPTPEPQTPPPTPAGSTPTPTPDATPTPATGEDATPPPKTVPSQPVRTESATPTKPTITTRPAVTSKPATPAPRPAAARPTIAARVPRGNGNGGLIGGLAFVLAICSVLAAGGAVVLAVYALDVAREAKSNAAIAVGGRNTAAPAPTSSGGPTASTAQTPAGSPAASARPIYLIDTLQGELRLPEPEGCVSVFVDIDAMRVGVDDGHEMYVTSCLGAPTFRIDRAAVVPVTSPVTTPEQCAELLAKETPGQESVVLVRSGLVMCLLTSAQDAQRQLIPQRIGIVEVRSINADRSISLVISTYRVPPS